MRNMKLKLLWLFLVFKIPTCDGSHCNGDCIELMTKLLRKGSFSYCEKCIYDDQCTYGLTCFRGSQTCNSRYNMQACSVERPRCKNCSSTVRGEMTPKYCDCKFDISLPNAWVQDGYNYSKDIGEKLIYVPERLDDGSLAETDTFARAIVCAHNFYRTANFSGKTGIQTVKWNRNLAKFAHDHSQFQKFECKMIHSNNRTIAGYTGYVGENLYIERGRNFFWKYAMFATGSWYKEIEGYQYSESSYKGCPKRNGKYVIEHFTQVMWSTTREIGCDYVECGDKKVIVTCVYAPGGNTGHPAFSKQAQEALNSWHINDRFGGLPAC